MEIGLDIDTELQRKAERRALDAGYASVSNWISDLVMRELQQDPIEKALAEVLGTLDRQKGSKRDEKLDGVKNEIERFLEDLRKEKSGVESTPPRDHIMTAYKNSRRRFDSVYRRLAQ